MHTDLGRLYSARRLRDGEDEDPPGHRLLSLFREASGMAQTWANLSVIDAGFYVFPRYATERIPWCPHTIRAA